MKILVLGSGAREHAIVKSLQNETPAHEILCAPGNAGMSCERVLNLSIEDPQAVLEFAQQNKVELVVIGPEAPLVKGVADPLKKAGIPVFGPGKEAAKIEGSKAFAKRIMDAAGVPTGQAVNVKDLDHAAHTLRELGAPHVVKADGLAAGKGVLVTDDFDAALDHVKTWLPHGEVLIEEFLDGEEVSLFFFSDGKTVLPLTPAQDFKRIFDGDEGPNTGGMGSYSPLSWLPEGFIDEVQQKVAQATVDQLRAEGTPFVGILYCGLILTKNGIRVIEFNARFGDPETQIVLERMTSPLSRYLMASAKGTLHELEAPDFSADAGVCVVLASEGYPGQVQTGHVITGIEAAEAVPGVSVIHAATALNDAGELLATGGRVLSVVATAPEFAEARANAYAAIEQILLAGSQYRRDIAAKAR